ncbi:MAG: VWA domain-containing protein [Bacteroidales bacterium]|nr:VWA domain-containing protein [Bacteroidales bacterium]
MENKTKIFNLVILDKSGSMSSIRKATISGLNETINGIRKAQLKFAKTQEHFFSLHSFCSCSPTDIYDLAPIAEVNDLRPKDYEPCCSTPLYDAIGHCLNKMKTKTEELENFAVIVTIITDGYENASKEFSGRQISKMIGNLREEGWTFAYMGADHDVEAVASQMNINNFRAFEHDDEGTQEALAFDENKRMVMYESLNCCCRPSLSTEERILHLKNLSDNFYSDNE